MEKFINQYSSQEKSKLTEENILMDSDKYTKSFPVQIISYQEKLISVTMSFDDENSRVIFITEDSKTIISVNAKEILGFVPPEYVNEDFKYKYRKIISSQDADHKLSLFNFYPKFEFNRCDCCGWICCHCTETVSVNKAKNIALIVEKQFVNEIQGEIKRITGDLYPLHKDLRSRRKLLLFVNPYGGRGTAIQTWNQVKFLFDLANIEMTVFHTQYEKHAYDYTLEMNIKHYDGIVCCSGDGIVHEVINAIFHREDKDEFIKTIPIGVIPGGTSNGFAKSLCVASGENYNPELCSFLIIKGFYREIDILEVETPSREKNIYSFLSVAWGLIADIDLESEFMRWAGELRYSLYGALRWMWLRKNFAALYYLPDSVYIDLNSVPSIKDPLDNSIFKRENDQFSYFWAQNVPWTSQIMNTAPKAKLDDGFCDMVAMKRSSGKFKLLKQLFNQDSGDYFEQNGEIKSNLGLEYFKTKCWRLIPKNNLDEDDNTSVNHNLPRFFSIDGERYPIEPIQVKVLTKTLRVFSFS